MKEANQEVRVAVETEVKAIHAFISAWFRGVVPKDAQLFDKSLRIHWARDLINIQPSGAALAGEEVLSAIQAGYGENPAFEISIADCTVRHVFEEGSRQFILATYVEHQTGARNSSSTNTRISTGLFERKKGSSDLTWLHLQETGVAESESQLATGEGLD